MDMFYLLKDYYRRQLSFKSDIIDAFTGIFSAFDRSPMIAGSVTHFYGIPILYSREHMDQAQTSFLDNLHWRIYGSKTGVSSNTNLFPSWSWAFVKASESAKCQSQLKCEPEWDPFMVPVKNDIAIYFSHQSQGPMRISRFTYHPDDYKHFSPWTDISTWVEPVIMEQDSLLEAGENRIWTHHEGSLIQIDDHYTPSMGNTYLVCLKTSTDVFQDVTKIAEWLLISGLLVQETSQGLYRRIGQFNGSFHHSNLAMTSDDGTACESKSVQIGKSSRWQWRTIRLI